MRDTAGNVLRIESLIEADAFGESLDTSVDGRIESAATTRAGGIVGLVGV